MKTLRGLCALAVLSATASDVHAQFTKPGPEHEMLKKLEGTWDVTMKFAGSETKGTVTYKMELGGLWLVSSLQSEIFGTKFYGKGMDTYDETKKKYIAVWFDSATTVPLVMEGDYDKEKKTMTLVGEGRGPDGKQVKHKSVTQTPDENTMLFSMYMGDEKEPAFTVTYKRKVK